MADRKPTPGPWAYRDQREHWPDQPFWIGVNDPECGFISHAAVRWGCDEAAALGDLEANARLMTAAPDLLGALVWREQFEPRAGEGDNERFERIAEIFYRETGHLRPGKDCRLESHEARQAFWDEWMEAGRARVRAAIASATGGASHG